MWLRALFLLSTCAFAVDFLGESLELPSQPSDQQDRPVIGILSLLNEGDYNLTGSSFIDAGYVKWIESAGARVVPLRIDHPWKELQFLVSRLDGVLFTGGDKAFFSQNGNMTFYAQTACKIYDLVKSLNDAGKHYPMWGTCLGFQLLHVCASPSPNTVVYMPDQPAHTAVSKFTYEGQKSRIFANEMGQHIIFLMQNANVTYVNHNSGVFPSEYSVNSALSSAYRVLTTMQTLSGVSYVGLIEGKQYPIFGSQFHPEKNAFEWWPEEAIPHSLPAIVTASYFADFFVQESRKNVNQFASETELQSYLIYNWSPFYWNQDPVQVYLFD